MSITGGSLGAVHQLWRYPVKSMQGEQVQAAPVTERGIVGDRAYAIVERASGRVASAKHPRKWAALLTCQARYSEPPQIGHPLPPVVIRLPDGREVSSADPAADHILSRALGHAVMLITDASECRLRETDRTPLDADTALETIREEPLGLAAPPGTFFDVAAIHLLTTATLRYLQANHPPGRFDVRRFRPNMLIEAGPAAPACVEQTWLDQSLRAGGAILRTIDPSPRCVVTTLGQADLPRDPQILRTLASATAGTSITLAPGAVFHAVAGIYATVTTPGTVACGDPLAAG